MTRLNEVFYTSHTFWPTCWSSRWAQWTSPGRGWWQSPPRTRSRREDWPSRDQKTWKRFQIIITYLCVEFIGTRSIYIDLILPQANLTTRQWQSLEEFTIVIYNSRVVPYWQISSPYDSRVENYIRRMFKIATDRFHNLQKSLFCHFLILVYLTLNHQWRWIYGRRFIILSIR